MMGERVVQILQHYRHDLMNHLQIVQGYVGMRNIEKAEKKLGEIVDYYNEERKLMSLNMPEFMIWIIQFNVRYENLRLTYKVHSEYKNLHVSDSILVKQFQDFMERCVDILNPEELYEVTLVIEESSDTSMKIMLSIPCETDEAEQLMESIKKMQRDGAAEIVIAKTMVGLCFGLIISQ
ncbi:Spo0B domain-containing protein [Oceanobacillus profundus]|uniref:SpoOB alpha-helical domain-containing protein n=2 Tax=Bacillaceae TaxID=186817 RepID=A0A417YJ56_9BACI|nr:Spo0B domain-containing protein [Oceanobacillus profundus]RHW33043.1 hypothetical protein D1B32_08335 [Oceanobacillus profundus]